MGIKAEYQSIFALFSDHLSVPENELITTAFVNNVVSTDDSIRNPEPKQCPVIHSQLECQVPTSFSASALLPNRKASFLPFLPIERPLFPRSHRSVSFKLLLPEFLFQLSEPEAGISTLESPRGFPLRTWMSLLNSFVAFPYKLEKCSMVNNP